MADPDFLHTQREYACQRRCSERTVERERANGTGCPFVKIGRAVRYRQRDILDFIERHVRQSTSEAPPKAAPKAEPQAVEQKPEPRLPKKESSRTVRARLYAPKQRTNGCDPSGAPIAAIKDASAGDVLVPAARVGEAV